MENAEWHGAVPAKRCQEWWPYCQVHAHHCLCSEDLPYDEGKHLSSGEEDPVGSSRQEGAVLRLGHTSLEPQFRPIPGPENHASRWPRPVPAQEPKKGKPLLVHRKCVLCGPRGSLRGSGLGPGSVIIWLCDCQRAA